LEISASGSSPQPLQILHARERERERDREREVIPPYLGCKVVIRIAIFLVQGAFLLRIVTSAMPLGLTPTFLCSESIPMFVAVQDSCG